MSSSPPPSSPSSSTLAGAGGPKRLLNEFAAAFVKLVGFKDGCSSPSWKVDAILSKDLQREILCKLGHLARKLNRESKIFNLHPKLFMKGNYTKNSF